jgi:hypothetical protein
MLLRCRLQLYRGVQKEEKVVEVKNTFGTNSAAKILRKWLNTTVKPSCGKHHTTANPTTKPNTVANVITNN